MKLLQVGQYPSVHLDRWESGWNSVGVNCRTLVLEPNADEELSSSAKKTVIKAAISSFKPDIVQAGPLPTAGFTVSGTWSGPLIATSWGYDLDPLVIKENDWQYEIRRVIQGANVVLVDNEAMKDTAKVFGASDEQLYKIPWGIDLQFFHESHESFTDSTSVRLFCSRNHEPVYNVELVLRTFLKLAQIHPQVVLRIAGSGSQTDELKSIAAESIHSDRVFFLGSIDRVKLRDELWECDYYISASLTDGSSVSLLEAMACGTPVVVSDIPGNKEWLLPNRGYLFNHRDELGLFAVLDALLENPLESKVRANLQSIEALTIVRKEANWVENLIKLKNYVSKSICEKADSKIESAALQS